MLVLIKNEKKNFLVFWMCYLLLCLIISLKIGKFITIPQWERLVLLASDRKTFSYIYIYIKNYKIEIIKQSNLQG